MDYVDTVRSIRCSISGTIYTSNRERSAENTDNDMPDLSLLSLHFVSHKEVISTST
jgi:hypothetical protein